MAKAKKTAAKSKAKAKSTHLTPEGRAAIVAAQEKRWRKFHKEQREAERAKTARKAAKAAR